MGKLYDRDINVDSIKHPTCFYCSHSRLPSSELNYKEGWVGCIVNQVRNISPMTCYDTIMHEGCVLGWVYSKIPPTYKGDTIPSLAGISTNDCLLVKGVRSCPYRTK